MMPCHPLGDKLTPLKPLDVLSLASGQGKKFRKNRGHTGFQHCKLYGFTLAEEGRKLDLEALLAEGLKVLKRIGCERPRQGPAERHEEAAKQF